MRKWTKLLLEHRTPDGSGDDVRAERDLVAKILDRIDAPAEEWPAYLEQLRGNG